jgi:hypothetical protein
MPEQSLREKALQYAFQSVGYANPGPMDMADLMERAQVFELYLDHADEQG